jgi:futalosine hydrolase
MRVTIVVATKIEIQPLLDKYQAEVNDFKGLYVVNDSLHVLITGMGMMQTAAHLMGYAMQFDRDFYIDAGIAGAFNRNLELGETVQIISETYGDFGVENDEKFEDFFEIGLLDKSESVFEYGLMKPVLAAPHKHIKLKKATSITVNKVHGNEHTIQTIISKYHADIENMECLAFYYVLALLKKPSIEIRSVSNYVEKRNKNNWKMDIAIKNLNEELLGILQKINI